MPRVTKAMLEEEIERLKVESKVKGDYIENLTIEMKGLKDQIKIYEKFSMYLEEGSNAIKITSDAVAHVLSDLKRK